MIGLLPRYRPRALKRPALAYTRIRRRRAPRVCDQAPRSEAVSSELVLFQRGAVEFPVATARPREARGRAVALVGALQRWLAAHWQWLRPRTVPVAVAALGLAATVKFSDYLAHYQDSSTPHTRVVHVDLAKR